MAYVPRSGLFGFLLLLAALAPSPGLAASSAGSGTNASTANPAQLEQAADERVEARLRRISAALREQDPAASATTPAPDTKLAWVFVNAPGGFRNGGWGNGGFRNGGWGNGGFRNGGWGNGGGWRNGGFLNRW